MVSSLTIMPYMMMPGDHEIAGRVIHALLSKPPAMPALAPPASPAVDLSGVWEVQIAYTSGVANHHVEFEQKGAQLAGVHRGETLSGDLSGVVEGDAVRFQSSHHIEGTNLHYSFEGTASGATMSGRVGLGEYGSAQWTGKRHVYRATHANG
jgi:hypothetical protein